MRGFFYWCHAVTLIAREIKIRAIENENLSLFANISNKNRLGTACDR
jgi:hypothetical protein